MGAEVRTSNPNPSPNPNPDQDGVLEELYPHSGHYRPGEHHLRQLLARQHSQTRLSRHPPSPLPRP